MIVILELIVSGGKIDMMADKSAIRSVHCRMSACLHSHMETSSYMERMDKKLELAFLEDCEKVPLENTRNSCICLMISMIETKLVAKHVWTYQMAALITMAYLVTTGGTVVSER